MFHDLTKAQKRALRDAAALAHQRDRRMSSEDRVAHYLEARNSDLPIIVGGAVANGIIALEDVAGPARELIAEVAERLRSLSEEIEASKQREKPESVWYDADAAVSVGAVVAEIDFLRDDATTLYVNRRTGEVRVLPDEYFDDDIEADDDVFEVDEEALPEESTAGAGKIEEPAWLTETRTEARTITSSPDWIALVDKYDIDEYHIMKRFARRAAPAASRDLEDALQGRGAFRRFRDVIHRRGLGRDWDAFRREMLSDLVRSALEQNGITFRR